MPQVTMPQLGEGVEQGTIGKWLKAVGDHVRIGDPLVEVVTDKVNAEVPSPFEGTLSKILVSEGDTIANDVPIAEVDVSGSAERADRKAVAAGLAQPVPAARAESRAPMPVTEVGPVNQRVAAVPGAPKSGAAAPLAPGASADTEAPATAASPATAARAAPATAASTAPMTARPATLPFPPPSRSRPGLRMTPAVRRLARERGVDIRGVTGSGMGGRITRQDVERAAAGLGTNGVPAAALGTAPTALGTAPAALGTAPAALGTPSRPARPRPGHGSRRSARAPASPADSPVRDGDSLKQLSPMRKAIAAQMTRSLEVPVAYITVEVDMTAVVRTREAVNGDYKAREGNNLSFVAYMTKACVEALRKHHDLNAHWTPEGHWRRKDINIGIAVAVPDGLVVPVIHKAQDLSLHGLNAAINDLASRARNKRLRPEDLEGGTFTVDNTGWTGSILTLPIINVPEVAIITMERIVKRPVVLEAQGDAIAVRSMMNMCIAIDHRATDGAQAGEFLADVRRWLEAVDERTPIW